MPQDDDIRIDQFWDKNPLAMPWMIKFLPENRMWQDGMTNLFWTFVIVVVDYFLLSYVLPNNVVSGIICVLPGGYILGRFNNRMARAQRKFAQAKRDEGRNGNANTSVER